MNTINLIRAKTLVSPQMETIIRFFQRLSFYAFVLLIASGIIAGGAWYYFTIQRNQLTKTEQELSLSISQNTVKEGLLLAVKHHVGLANAILNEQTPVGKLFDILGMVISPDQLSTVSIDNHNQVLMTIRVSSINDIIAIVDAVVKQSDAHFLRSPQLMSFSITDAGNLTISLSFIAVL